MTVEDWMAVLFSDESQFNLIGSDGKRYCQRDVGEEFMERNIQKTVTLWYGASCPGMVPAA